MALAGRARNPKIGKARLVARGTRPGKSLGKAGNCVPLKGVYPVQATANKDPNPMKNPIRAFLLAAAFTASLGGAYMGATTMAEARTYHSNSVGRYYVDRHGNRVYVERYDRARYQPRDCGRSATKGTVIGGLGGALAGNVIGHSTGSTLVGAGVGAVAGHEIAKDKCRRG
jgi:hypothetical protein